jgi:putative endonuclease
MFFTYILHSEKDNKYYYGSTSDLESRIKAHNKGKVRSTKSRRPLMLVYSESFSTKKEAIQRELFFKSIAGYAWLKEQKII